MTGAAPYLLLFRNETKNEINQFLFSTLPKEQILRMSSYFSRYFEANMVIDKAGQEKKKRANAALTEAIEKFEKDVHDAFASEAIYSRELVIPNELPDKTRLEVIQELCRRFPRRVRVFYEPDGSWISPEMTQRDVWERLGAITRIKMSVSV